MSLPFDHKYRFSPPFIMPPPLRQLELQSRGGASIGQPEHGLSLSTSPKEVANFAVAFAGNALSSGARRSVVGDDCFEIDAEGKLRRTYKLLPPGSRRVVVRQTRIADGETLDTTFNLTVADAPWDPFTIEPELVLTSFRQDEERVGTIETITLGGSGKDVPLSASGKSRMPRIAESVGTTAPVQTADGSGIAFQGDQRFRFGGAEGANTALIASGRGPVRAYRWELLIFRVDGNSGTGDDLRLFVINEHASSKSGRLPRVIFRKGVGVIAQWNMNDGTPAEITLDNVVADGTTWNTLLTFRRHGRLFARLNGVEQVSGTVRWSTPDGNNACFVGDANVAAPSWALDTLLIGQSDLTEAKVAKLEAWAGQRIAELPGGAPFSGTPPIVDADDFGHRYQWDQERWKAWRSAARRYRDSTENIAVNNTVAPPVSGYATVFRDDFRARHVAYSVETETDFAKRSIETPFFAPSPNPSIQANGDIETTGSLPHDDLYVHDPVNGTLNLAMSSNRNGIRASGMASVTNDGAGYAWGGQSIWRIRVKFDADLFGTEVFAAPMWRYSLEHLLWQSGERIEFDDYELFGYSGTYSKTTLHVHEGDLPGLDGHSAIDTMDKSTPSDMSSLTVWPEWNSINSALPSGVNVFDNQFHTWETRVDTEFTTLVLDDSVISRFSTPPELLERMFFMSDNVPKDDSGSWMDFKNYDATITPLPHNTGNGSLALATTEALGGSVTIPVGSDRTSHPRVRNLINDATPGSYEIRFTSSTSYTVRTLGSQTLDMGVVGTAYVGGTSAYPLKHTVTSGTTPFVAGDGFDVVVAQHLHGMTIDSFEVLQPASVLTAVSPPFAARPTLSRSGNTISCVSNISGVVDVWYYWFSDAYPRGFGIDPTYTVRAGDTNIRCMVKAVGYIDSPEAWSDALQIADTTVPTITSANPSGTYIEGATIGGKLTASETVTWSKSGADAAALTLDPETGVWALESAGYDGKASYAWTFTATGAAGNASRQFILIALTDAEEEEDANTVVVDGTGQIGTMLWATPSAEATTFQWKVDGTAIPGATARNFHVSDAHEGAQITCSATIGGRVLVSNAVQASWVRTLQDGTRALLDFDYENGRFWFDGAEYDFAEIQALDWTPADMSTPIGDIFTTGALPFPGYDPASGAFIVDATPIDNGVNSKLLTLDTGSSSNRIDFGIQRTASDDVLRASIAASGQSTASASSPGTASEIRKSYAMFYSGTDIYASERGVISSVTKAAGAPPACSRMWLGAYTNGGGQFSGTLHRLTYFPGSPQKFDIDLLVGRDVVDIEYRNLAENDALSGADVLGTGLPALINVTATGPSHLFRQKVRGVWVRSQPYAVANSMTEGESALWVDKAGDGRFGVMNTDQDGYALYWDEPVTPGDYLGAWGRTQAAYNPTLFRKVQALAAVTLPGDDRPTVFYTVEGASGTAGRIGKLRWDGTTWQVMTGFVASGVNGAWWIDPTPFSDGRLLFSCRSNAHPAANSGLYILDPVTGAVETIVSNPLPRPVDWNHPIHGDFFGNGNEDVAAHVGWGAGTSGDSNFYIFDRANSWNQVAINAGSPKATRYNVINASRFTGKINGRDPILLCGHGTARVYAYEGPTDSDWRIIKDFTGEMPPGAKFDGGVVFANLFRMHEPDALISGDSINGRLIALKMR